VLHRKNAFVIIGATAGATAGKLPPMEADPASVDAAIGGAVIPRFILDLRPARDEPPVFAWLSERRTLHANLTTVGLHGTRTLGINYARVDGVHTDCSAVRVPSRAHG
jgi:hypothetical protein